MHNSQQMISQDPPDLEELNQGRLIFGVRKGLPAGVTKSHAIAWLARNCPIFVLKTVLRLCKKKKDFVSMALLGSMTIQ